MTNFSSIMPAHMFQAHTPPGAVVRAILARCHSRPAEQRFLVRDADAQVGFVVLADQTTGELFETSREDVHSVSFYYTMERE